MKLINKMIWLTTILVMVFTGCSNNNLDKKKKVEISQETLGYRNTSLDNEKDVVVPEFKYSKDVAGSSKRIKRAFQDAPPMIPHDTEGMLPITKENNQCIACHVDSAPYDKTIPSVPVSHMTNFRPTQSLALKGVNTSNEKLKNVSIKKQNSLNNGRFNCSQCHAPQSNAKLVTPNLFKPEFTSKDGAFKSSWDDKKFMEDIDTVK